MLTTTIGAFPKPPGVPITDWFGKPDGDYTSSYVDELAVADDAERRFDEATRWVVQAQVDAGIDIPTDGEVRRENYIHYQCRHLAGIDFGTLTPTRMRGTTDVLLPTVTGPVVARPGPLARDYVVAQAATDRPVKMTLPGPLTIVDSIVDAYYHDGEALAADLAAALNAQVRELVVAGCTWIQVDEPVMARRPDDALAWGIEQLGRCFEGVPSAVNRVVHVCCGYPRHLDDAEYEKASPAAYLALAAALDDAPVDAVSIEDAHRHNDLDALLPRFAATTVIVGAIAIASSRLEPVDEIRARLELALDRAPAGVIAAPDCGLGYLPTDLALAKLRHLAAAAHSLGG